MDVITINNKEHLQGLIEDVRLVIVASLGGGFLPDDVEFERIALENDQPGIAFAKFTPEEAPELADHFEIDNAATIFTFIGGEKGETVVGFEPSRWEEMVKEVAGME